MIYIFEDKPIKLSGTTSIFLCFQYNQAIIDIIKQCEVAIYHKKNNLWEVTVNNLAFLLDSLTYLDDIKLIVKEEEKQSLDNIKLVCDYKLPPFKYQEDGIKYGLANDKWLLLDGMGLGKTAQIIGLARELKAQRNLKHCLIICGVNAVKTNWRKEIQKHSDESVRILGEKINSRGTITYASIPDRAEELKNGIDEFFVITNIETLRDDRIIEAIKNSKDVYDMIVVDEVHRCIAGDSIITTSDGLKTIKEIVDNKLKCDVLSYNISKDIFEYKPINNYYNNGQQELIELIIEENGMQQSLRCTPEHKIYTRNRGYVKAKDLDENDDILLLN